MISHSPICGNPIPDDPFCFHSGFPLDLPDGKRRRRLRQRTSSKSSDFLMLAGTAVALILLVLFFLIRQATVKVAMLIRQPQFPAPQAPRNAASLFFTRFTRLLTSYRRINTGLNEFNRSHTPSGFWKPGSSHRS